jgi:hypothetical protein
MQDFGHCMKWLVDEAYPAADVIRVVLDNLKTHRVAALYATFSPTEAQRIRKKLEFHYTPKHGSWLNMAEIELSVYSRQLNKHIPDEETLAFEAQALTERRNRTHATVHWQFRATDARVKLRRLYPSISD